MEYEYDSWNRIQNMTYPDGEVVSYRYNKGGMLQSIIGEKNGISYPYIGNILYDEFELKKKKEYGNSTHTEYEYDDLQRLVHLESRTLQGEWMQDIVYDYDGVGNITKITNVAGALANGLGGTYNNGYTYDNLYRLTYSVGSWSGHTNLSYEEETRYYPNGRIYNKVLEADVSTQTPGVNSTSHISYDNYYHYENTGQPNTLTSIESSDSHELEWDATGNMVYHQNNREGYSRHLCWDEENRLQGVKDKQYLSFYQYDANGERTYKLTGSVGRQNISGRWSAFYLLDNPTLYPSPYIVVTRKGYTKHYYAENERIASRIGGGGIIEIDTPIVEWEVVRKKALDLNCTHLKKVLECLRRPDVSIKNTLKDIYKYKNIVNQEEECYWYHPDHLGSSSWITFSDGKAVQHLHYLPWGENFVDQRSTGWNARFTFSAKERDTETGLSYFGSRYYSSDLSIWLSVDPQAAKYPSLSPYVYCADNPVKLVDPNGEEIGEFIDKGVIIGNDGKKDGKLYAVNNRSLSTKDYLQTKRFIKKNSGNTAAFEQNNIAYKNSTSVESSSENRQAMLDIVSQDDGKGGTSPNNNREYGGKYDANGKIIPLPSGNVGDLNMTDQLYYDPSNIFHSHPSGSLDSPIDLFDNTATIGLEYETKNWVQEPSLSDKNNCNGRTRYVFGMRDKTVYIYNGNGIQATIPMNRFVNPSK